MSRHQTLVGAQIVLVLGSVSFVAAMVGLEDSAPGAARLGPLSALMLAAMPSMLWLGYFSLQDRREPNPKAWIVGVFVLGALVAAPLAGFVASLLPVAGADLDPLGARRVLVVGVVQEIAMYVVVRCSTYRPGELHEPTDGIVYMTAAGLGFATAQSYDHLISLGGTVMLSQAASTAVVTTLAHAGCAAVLGHALGPAKRSATPPILRGVRLFGGLCAAAALDGAFTALDDHASFAAIDAGVVWPRIAGAAGFAAAVFFVVSILITRRLRGSRPATSSW